MILSIPFIVVLMALLLSLPTGNHKWIIIEVK